MGKPICVIWRKRPTTVFMQLTPEEQGRLTAEHMERHEKAGAKHIIVLDTYWSTEAWYAAGVAEFKDIDALQEFERVQREANAGLYMTSEIMLGTKLEGP